MQLGMSTVANKDTVATSKGPMRMAPPGGLFRQMGPVHKQDDGATTISVPSKKPISGRSIRIIYKLL